MKIEDIKELWDQDSQIDETELAKESVKTPDIYNKYLKIYAQEKMILPKYNIEKSNLKKFKWDYYTGKSDPEVYKKTPFDLKILKQDIPVYLEADDELCEHEMKISYQSEKVAMLEKILKSLETRGFQIKNAIDFERMMGGPI